MIKKHIPIIVLALVLLNIPSITLETLSISISSPISYLLFLLLAVLIFLEDKRYPKEIIFLAVISSLYFFIAAINYNGLISGLIIVYIKFLLYLFGLYTAIKKVNKKKIINNFIIRIYHHSFRFTFF